MTDQVIRRPRARALVAGGILAASLFAASHPAQALVQVTLDTETLNDFLRIVTPPKVTYTLPTGAELALELRDVRVTGFDPAAGNGRGHILTSLTLGIPALGLTFPVTPQLSLHLEKGEGGNVCVLRFEKLTVPLVATGALDVSSLLPVYRVPTEGAWAVSLATGDVQVKSRLVDTRLGSEGIRLGFDVDLEGAPANPATGSRGARTSEGGARSPGR